MEYCLMIARSVTYAQRMQSVMVSNGIRCQIFRAPKELTDRGCAYAVRIPENQMTPALMALNRAQLTPMKIYLTRNNGYREAVV